MAKSWDEFTEVAAAKERKVHKDRPVLTGRGGCDSVSTMAHEPESMGVEQGCLPTAELVTQGLADLAKGALTETALEAFGTLWGRALFAHRGAIRGRSTFVLQRLALASERLLPRDGKGTESVGAGTEGADLIIKLVAA